jgi:hypothetical protein
MSDAVRGDVDGALSPGVEDQDQTMESGGGGDDGLKGTVLQREIVASPAALPMEGGGEQTFPFNLIIILLILHPSQEQKSDDISITGRPSSTTSKLTALKLGGSGSGSASGSGSGSISSSSLNMTITPSSISTGLRPGSTSPVSPGAGAGALNGPPSTTTLQIAEVLGAPAIPGAGAGAGVSGAGGVKQQQPRNWNVISPPILANPKCSEYFVEPVGVLRHSLIFVFFVFCT